MYLSPYHVEISDEEYTQEYSLADARRFCQVLNSVPSELFGVNSSEPPLPASELVQLIGAECRKRNINLEEFEVAVGWRLSQSMHPPERLFEDMSLDGLQWLCRELGIHWHRVIMALSY